MTDFSVKVHVHVTCALNIDRLHDTVAYHIEIFRKTLVEPTL